MTEEYENLSYDDKLALLEKIIHDGVEKLLTEAKEKDFLSEPYGRADFPTPVLTEDQFVAQGGVECDDEEPPFNFEFGFNPLQILADFIQWSHPASVAKRQADKDAAAAELMRRAEHARRQLGEAAKMKKMLEVLRSGVLWGPISTPINSSTVSVVCKPIKQTVLVGDEENRSSVACKVIFEISAVRDFSTIAATAEVPVQSRPTQNDSTITETADDATGVAAVTGLDDILPAIVEFTDLHPGTQYFTRCCLMPIMLPTEPVDADAQSVSSQAFQKEQKEQISEVSPCDAFQGQTGGAFQMCSFWTLPNGDEAASTAATGGGGRRDGVHGEDFGSESVSGAGSAPATADIFYPSVEMVCMGDICSTGVGEEESVVDSQFSSDCPRLGCVVGDFFSDSSSKVKRINSILSKNPSFNVGGPLRDTSVLLGWLDTSTSSIKMLRDEEEAHKKLRHDVKRYQKKYGDSKSSSSKNRKSKSSSSSSKKDDSERPPPPVAKRPEISDALRCLVENFPVDYNGKPFGDDIILQQQEIVRVQVRDRHPQDENSENNEEHSFSPKTAGAIKSEPLASQALVGFSTVDQLDKLRPTRQIFRSLMLGADVEVFVLDMKGGKTADSKNDFQQMAYLGKAQAQWLQHGLTNSTAMWKVLVCGQTFGLVYDSAGELNGSGSGSGNGSNINISQVEVVESDCEPLLVSSPPALEPELSEDSAGRRGNRSRSGTPTQSDGRSPNGRKSPSGRQSPAPKNRSGSNSTIKPIPLAPAPIQGIMRVSTAEEQSSAPMDGTIPAAHQLSGEAPEFAEADTFEVLAKPTSGQGPRKSVSMRMAPETVVEEKMEHASSSHSLHSVLLACKADREKKLQRMAAAAAEAMKAQNDDVSVSSNVSTLLDGASSVIDSKSMSRVASTHLDAVNEDTAEPIETEDGARIVRLSSGIVMLSGGFVVGTPLESPPPMPSFVSAYADIFGIGSEAAAMVFGQTLQSALGSTVNTAASESFCVEVGMGSKKAAVSSEHESCDSFVYNEGLHGVTLWDSRSLSEDADTKAPMCKLHLNNNGSLRISLNNSFHCELRAPVPLTDVPEPDKKED